MSATRIYQRIGIDVINQLLARDNLLIFDSRDPASYSLAHIAGARRLSSENLDATLLGTPKTAPILLYCYHGNASQIYGQMFADFGFGEVYSLDGGFAAWQRLQAKNTLPKLSPRLAQWLPEHGYPIDDLDAVAEHGMTPLMRAGKLGEIGIVFDLLQAGATLDTKNSDGNNALWLACVGENLETIELLIRAGIDINHQNDNGANCLMYASSTGKHTVVEKLLAFGADPKYRTLDDYSALDMAATIECLRLLRRVEQEALRIAS